MVKPGQNCPLTVAHFRSKTPVEAPWHVHCQASKDLKDCHCHQPVIDGSPAQGLKTFSLNPQISAMICTDSDLLLETNTGLQ